jgi:hypothetical protein
MPIHTNPDYKNSSPRRRWELKMSNPKKKPKIFIILLKK